MLFDTDAGVTDSIDLGDCRTSIRTLGTAASFYVPMWPNPENRDKWTFSCWLKRSVLGVATSVFGTATSAYDVSAGNIGFNTSNQLIFSNSSSYWSFTTNRVFIDTSAWMYLQVNYDSAQAVSTERIKIYINGVRELDFATATYPTISRASTINLVDQPHQIGFNGELYLANVCFIDGQNLEPSAFGYKSTVYNEWRSNTQAELATLCSSYGVSSFFLDFKNGSTSSALGNDASTHNNDWTVPSYVLTGATTNWYKEGPGNPYPTLGTSDPGMTSTLSLGNLRYTGPASQGQQRRTQKAVRGKVYFEVTRVSGTTGAYIALAIAPLSAVPGSAVGSYGWNMSNGYITYNNTVVSSRTISTVVGDVLMFAVDLDNAKVWQGVNGVWYGNYVPPTGAVSLSELPKYEDWFLGVGSAAACVLDCNFGQRPFAYSPPPGFNSQCNLNDLELSITNPSLHFDVLTGTGAEIKSLVDGSYGGNCIGLIKDRGNAANWQFVDAARGLSVASPFPSGSWAETSYVTPAGNSVAYVFNTATVPAVNSSGTVTVKPTVSGNTVAGISAVAYHTENYKTLGHGLDVAPELIIAKMRNAATSRGWSMWGTGLTGKSLNTLTASATEAWWSTSATLLTLSSGNTDSNYYSTYSTGIAYCFAQKTGFSRIIFIYVGNASTDGPFVYLGFKPKLVIIKHATATSGHWVFIDSVRSPGNYVNDALYTDSNAAEVVTANTTGAYIQFLSTGFKVCSSHVDVNATGVAYNVIAFADVGETYALAR